MDIQYQRERELYHFFGRTDETPSKAAFYHQRAKLKDNALWELLAKVLANPEMWALLNSLAKTMK